MVMKFYSYTREKQFTQEIENCIGIKKPDNEYTHDIFHPIINGVCWFGIFHTNAENVKEIEIDFKVKHGGKNEYLN